ncbi:MAG: hypothetical protein WBK76_00970 [Candidatus Saccharimonadales bacterium]
MAELKLRLNLDAEEVELVVDDEVALSSGKDVFVNWVEAYNEKHKPVEQPATAEEPVDVERPVEEKVVEVDEETVEEVSEVVDESATEAGDTEQKD